MFESNNNSFGHSSSSSISHNSNETVTTSFKS